MSRQHHAENDAEEQQAGIVLSRQPSGHAAAIWAVFVLSTAAVFLLTADVFHPALDEGIYLEGGRRILHGQVLYRDFFAYTGPLIYWIQAALEAIFGPAMRPLRLSVAVCAGMMCAGTYWLAAGFRGWRIGTGTAAVFLCFTLPSLFRFTINHRWLSGGLMTIGIAAAVEACRVEDRRLWFTAGALLATAGWATPPCLLPLLFLLGWLVSSRIARKFLPPVLAGIALVSLPAVAALAIRGALVPMINDILWALRNYGGSNRVSFGSFPGGIRITGIGSLIQAARFEFAAVLIVIGLIGGLVAIARGEWASSRVLLWWLALAMFLTSWPRWDVQQLMFVTPPFYVLAVLWCEDAARTKIGDFARTLVYAGCLFTSFYFLNVFFTSVQNFVYFPTRMGMLRSVRSDGDALATLAQRIPAGDTVFVFPYLPIMSYLLEARNPASYAWLQPGMMNLEDENRVMGELTRSPPHFVIRQYLPENQILSVWPNSNRSTMTFQAIENFIARDYREVARVKSDHFILTVFEHR